MAGDPPRPRRLIATESGIVGALDTPSASDIAAGSVVNCYAYHRTVFPGLPDDFAEFKRLVRSLSRTDALFWCARINLVVSGSFEPNELDRHRDLVRWFFSEEDMARIDAFTRDQGGRDVSTIFFRGQVLELMRWVALFSEDQPDDGRTFYAPGTRRVFARAALMASSIWERRVYGNRLDGGIPVDAARHHAPSAIRRAHIETASAPYPMVAVARGVSLFLEQMRPAHEELDRAFLDATGLSLDDYCSVFALITVDSFGRSLNSLSDPHAYGVFGGRDDGSDEGPLRQAMRAVFDREAQTADELRRAYWGDRVDADEEDVSGHGFKPVLGRPLLRAKDGQMIVLDARSFTERASSGPLFDLVQARHGEGNKWFAAFGNAFEKYCNDLLRRVYPEGSALLAKRFIPNPMANAGREEVEIADAVLFGPSSVAVVEAKAAWLADKNASPELDGDRYRAAIREKYGTREISGAGERKVRGYGQLARSLQALADGSWKPRNEELLNLRRIIPVLVVHDANLNAVGHSRMFADEFALLMDPERDPGDWRAIPCGELVVAHLVVMTVDDLELLETSSEAFSIMDCLEDYARECADRTVSFHNYLVRSTYRGKLRPNAWMVDKAQRLLEDIASRLFPSTSEE